LGLNIILILICFLKLLKFIKSMKGTLINKEGKWFVKYLKENRLWGQKTSKGSYTGVYVELPLHPYNEQEFKLLTDSKGNCAHHLQAGDEVEFKIVEVEPSMGVNYGDYSMAKLIQPESITREVVQEAMKAVSKDVRHPKAVRDGLIQPKEDEAEQWDKIRNELAILCNGKNEQYEFLSWSRLVFIFDYLKEHYNVPTKKK
jgi:hypothetical protein